MACINFIDLVRDKIAERLQKISSAQGGAINHFMELRGNAEPDCAALANAVAEMLRGAEKEIAKEIARHAEADGIDLVKKTIHKRPSHVRKKIRAEYNGQNMSEICARYGVSRSTVWRYCGRG